MGDNWGVGIVVLTLVLVILVALVVAWHVVKKEAEVTAGAETFGGTPYEGFDGGYESGAAAGGRHAGAINRFQEGFSSLLNAHSSGTAPDDLVRGTPSAVGGGTAAKSAAASKTKVKPWRSFETWQELARDQQASQRYWKECNDFVTNLPKDWSKVRKAAKKMIDDDREWAGHIDIVNGVPEIVTSFRSASGIDETEKSARRASVSADVMKKVWEKPGLLAFHTHPTDPTVHPDFNIHPPSPPDIGVAVTSGFHGHFAAQVVLSPQAIFIYGLQGQTVTQLWNSEHPYFYAARLAYDTYSTMAATRSYHDNRRLDEDESILRKFGVFYYVIPEDGYAQSLYNTRSRWGSFVDFEDLELYIQDLRRAQQKIVESEKKTHKSKKK